MAIFNKNYPMKSVLLTFVFFLIVSLVHAQNAAHYSRAKIFLDASHSMQDLSATGLAVDHGEYKQNTFFISDFSDREIDMARRAGFRVEIVINDVVKYYEEQNQENGHNTGQKTTVAVTCEIPPLPVPLHFHLGSYAGFFTYTELLTILDSMQMLYPGLISVRQNIDTFHSVEGRPIYWIRVSNNPTVDQPAKPQMLYTALHHAREPGSISSTVYYLWYLLENYATDPRVKAIVDNTELYFIPCVNPDGYLYNISTNPLGGGLWRKNRRDNGDGTFGVDLNRNYGFNWGFDNIGSSPHDSLETYRGTSAFSEPETRSIKWMADHHHFKFCLNFHSYNNDILYPWGYIPSLQTIDSNWFFAYGEFITRENHYRYGTCNQTLNYITNGDANDWMYGDTTFKPKIYGFTPEIGSIVSGFYPPATQIIPDCQNNLGTNLNTASLLLPFVSIQHTDMKILTQPTGFLHYSLQRLGFPDTATFIVNIIPLDSWLTPGTSPKIYPGMGLLQQVDDSISYSLLPSTPNGQLVSYVLQAYNGLYYVRDTVRFYYGTIYSFYTPQTSSLADWTSMGWGVCHSAWHSPSSCIQSSATGEDEYGDGEFDIITMTTPIDLTHALHAYLQFYTKWAIETDYDEATVVASVTGSGTGSDLCGKYTRPAQFGGYPVYDGQQPTWVREEMDLNDFIGQKINIEFDLSSDAAIHDKGFFFDDVAVIAILDSAQFVHPLTDKAPSLVTYPNPATDNLNVAISGFVSDQPLSAVLYDCVGREALHFMIGKPLASVDIKGVSTGVYYLKITDKSKSWPVRKIEIIK
jgi:carboxypeptidase T